MSDQVLEVRNLSKFYKLGVIGTGRLQEDLQHWWNIITKKNPSTSNPKNFEDSGNGRYIWALKDVNFEVQKGECLGIIGSNGSGKSTLLKIISKIVRPTHGVINGNGRVSSLLEVGIGFSDDLTGRENIYLNGYFLGLKKHEIKNKFDEIVDFAGIEGFIDTPVKRYSSGMYMRLAFAVAAHLEPDILIVDEVLAVGDADFQNKCLGKMRQVTQDKGRTIIFVSHNMQAITSLCNRAIWLQKGRIKALGLVNDVIENYLMGIKRHEFKQNWKNLSEAPGNDYIRFKSVELVPEIEVENDMLDLQTPLTVKFQFWNLVDNKFISARLQIFTAVGDCLFDIQSLSTPGSTKIFEGECNIPGNFFNEGSYFISILITKKNGVEIFHLKRCLSFQMADFDDNRPYYGRWPGLVRPGFPFRLQEVVSSHSKNFE